MSFVAVISDSSGLPKMGVGPFPVLSDVAVWSARNVASLGESQLTIVPLYSPSQDVGDQPLPGEEPCP